MQYEKLASNESVKRAIHVLAERNIHGALLENRAHALEKIKMLIPKGSSVMNGSSRTLEEIGFIDYLKSGPHGWNNLHETLLTEKDPDKQAFLRRQSVLSDFYLGSAHAIAETGEIIFVSNTGSQLPHLAYTSPNIILVVGTNKIVPTLHDAMKRVEEYVYPLEDKRMKDMGYSGSRISKLLVLKYENPYLKRNFTVLFVNEKLGF